MYPSIGVVVPTRNRPGLLRRTLAAIAAQDYPGPVSTVVVYDQSTPEAGLPASRVLTNSRTPGLAGARNTGILALDTDGLDTELVAFCDDDDEWAPCWIDFNSGRWNDARECVIHWLIKPPAVD